MVETKNMPEILMGERYINYIVKTSNKRKLENENKLQNSGSEEASEDEEPHYMGDY